MIHKADLDMTAYLYLRQIPKSKSIFLCFIEKLKWLSPVQLIRNNCHKVFALQKAFAKFSIVRIGDT
jgi:hypothetical protein